MIMAKYNRKEDATTTTPLISVEEVASERESFKLSWTVLANIREYVTYVKEATGREITSDEVVDKGMQRLFNSDKGFQHWLRNQNSNSRPLRRERRKSAETGVKEEIAESSAINKI
jgi:hypothetical protein